MYVYIEVLGRNIGCLLGCRRKIFVFVFIYDLFFCCNYVICCNVIVLCLVVCIIVYDF